MNEMILLGRGDRIIEIPQREWMKHLDLVPEHSQRRLAFMSEAHHRIRAFVVRELPRQGRALEPAYISKATGVSPDLTAEILEELERGLFFLVRNQDGDVSWAFPVTAEPTPHRVNFDAGETIYAA